VSHIQQLAIQPQVSVSSIAVAIGSTYRTATGLAEIELSTVTTVRLRSIA
jgi:hypothetical protein